MHHPIAPWYPAYDPCALPYDPCSCSGYGMAVAYVPVFCAQAPAPGGCRTPMSVPHELLGDPAGAEEAFIGGKTDVHLCLEYLVETDAPAPEVKLTLTSGGTTTTWSDTGIAVGYHVKEDFMSLKPGATVVLEVKDAAARLRWCETICC